MVVAESDLMVLHNFDADRLRGKVTKTRKELPLAGAALLGKSRREQRD